MKKFEKYLSTGLSDEQYLKPNLEWPTLKDRLGKPRITKNEFFPEIMRGIWRNYHNFNNFSYFDAGCGHGNDLRAIRKLLGGEGNFFGVDISWAEIIAGLEFYHRQENEDTEEVINFFGFGDLHDLRQVHTWDSAKKDFSRPRSIKDGEFDLVHMEAVLHAFGYGYQTYREKKESAQSALNELSRICKPGAKFFGRVSAFKPGTSHKEQMDNLMFFKEWRFIPKANEFIAMLKRAGFINIRELVVPHEKILTDASKRNIVKISFLAEKK